MTTDWIMIYTILGTGFGSVLTIFAMNLTIFSWLRSDIKAFDTKINSLEERMFFLSTGKTLSQAILDEKMKLEKEKK